jgi:hypothetical protein
MVVMQHNPNPQFSKAHLTALNINNFKVIDAMGIKVVTARSP